MQISARTDYAVRAMLTLAQAQQQGGGRLAADDIAARQDLPKKFLEAILADLRRGGLVSSARGPAGGYQLSRPATSIRIGDIIRAVDGPLAGVRGLRPHDTTYESPAEHLPLVWVALRVSIRNVLDEVSLHHLLEGRLPDHVRRLADVPDAWANR